MTFLKKYNLLKNIFTKPHKQCNVLSSWYLYYPLNHFIIGLTIMFVRPPCRNMDQSHWIFSVGISSCYAANCSCHHFVTQKNLPLTFVLKYMGRALRSLECIRLNLYNNGVCLSASDYISSLKGAAIDENPSSGSRIGWKNGKFEPRGEGF